MTELNIYKRRIRQYINRVHEKRYGESAPLAAEYTYDATGPIPFAEIDERKWQSIELGTQWGQLWASAWFRLSGEVPDCFAGHDVVALVNVGSEAAVMVDGTPVQGLTNANRTPGFSSGKRRIMLFAPAKGGEPVDLLIEAAANGLFGYHSKKEFIFDQAELAVLYPDIWQLGLDLEFLYDLADSLPEDSVRARRIWRGLNEAANAWSRDDWVNVTGDITKELLAPPAAPSTTTAWSIGHGHLDLGWLWPVWESRRKAGRTIATQLRLAEEYPDYVFGASQPQQYQWIKEDYPELYKRVRAAHSRGQWEPQGGMWVEPDMNITSGESLVRQLLYGKRFFRDEFGFDVKNLWLPDVFGYSAALPQILKLAGVDFFVTQKISWNESNVFPHHTFMWEGIDGTRILSHFLPANTYNADNRPNTMIGAERRFAQADISGDWLNLFGIGDGGGGPSRFHVEFARRGADTEGSPRMKLAPAHEFLDTIAKIPERELPLWRGELYLELHRGTYTTQARMKRYNRLLELRLRDAELLSVISGICQRERFAQAWRDTLLNQFHDILPGSSIKLVYDEAYRQSEQHLGAIEGLTRTSLERIHGDQSGDPSAFVVQNTEAWDRHELVLIPWKGANIPVITNALDLALVAQPTDGGMLVPVTVPPMGHTTLRVHAPEHEAAGVEQELHSGSVSSETPEDGRWSREMIIPVSATDDRMENGLITLTLAEDGTITSIYDREFNREVLCGSANRLRMWEDLPYSWDAWDISHYYRETTPQEAKLVERTLVESGPLRAAIAQRLSIGNSTIEQLIVLEAESKLVRIENIVEWNESHQHLRVQAEPALQALKATYEIQFGVVSRPTHGNTSWDAAQFEVAGQRFADLSQADYGLGIVNDCKYGHYIRDGILDLTLLRSPKDPDPEADLGLHEFTYGYYPHALGWEASDLLERAHDLNAPLLVHPVNRAPEVPEASEFAVKGGVVKLDTVKHAENRGDVIVRFYETRGTNHDVVFQSRRAIKEMQEVTLLEEPMGVKIELSPGGGSFATDAHLEFKPFQIRSFRIAW
jgi:alpha-mannosidase